VPEVSTRFWPTAFAATGYAITFFACLVGVPIVLFALGVAIAIDLARGLATGTVRQRLRKRWW
jgi:hypothetical protein